MEQFIPPELRQHTAALKAGFKVIQDGMKFYVKPPAKSVKSSGKTVLTKNISRKVIKGKHRIIRVRNGDTLWGIAKMYRTTVKKLVALNELKSAKHLRPNQKLIVPYRS